jgi:serine/threonine-protein kinase
MKIPGLGCLKGCLVTIIILFVASWLIWKLTPLPEWIGTGKGYWAQLSAWAHSVGSWFKHVGSKGGGN